VTALEHHFFVRKSGVNVKGTNKKKQTPQKTRCIHFWGKGCLSTAGSPGSSTTFPGPTHQQPGKVLGGFRDEVGESIIMDTGTKGLPVTLKRT